VFCIPSLTCHQKRWLSLSILFWVWSKCVLFSGTFLLRRMDLKIRIFLLNIIMLSMTNVCALILSKYPIWCRSIFEPCCHVLNCAFVYSSYSVIQGNAIFDCADEWVSLEVLTLMGDIVLDVRIWESSFPSWASDQKKWHGWLIRSSFNCLDTQYSSCYLINASSLFLVSPLSKSWNEIFLGWAVCVTCASR
jgi:hypothetical protein